MISAGFRPVAFWRPATSSFPHQPIFAAATNPFQFKALRTLLSHENSLLFSFQELTHSLPSHGTGYPAPSRLRLSISAKSFIYRTCKIIARNSFLCRTYKNKGLITLLFAAHTKKYRRIPQSLPILELRAGRPLQTRRAVRTFRIVRLTNQSAQSVTMERS